MALLEQGVVHAEDYPYMCSEAGQSRIAAAVAEKGLTGIVVCSCSPRMHEATFRKAAERAGINPYMVEIANIREHCSWIHKDMEEATEKATILMRAAVAKVHLNAPLQAGESMVTKRALVIGGGIAGIQTAIDIADAGYKVDIVEKTPSIGGRMSQLDKTFPTLDCSACILTPKWWMRQPMRILPFIHTAKWTACPASWAISRLISARKHAMSIWTSVPAAASARKSVPPRRA